jgi:hypothetical protein
MGRVRTCAVRYDEPRLRLVPVWTSLSIMSLTLA